MERQVFLLSLIKEDTMEKVQFIMPLKNNYNDNHDHDKN
jgi:hypothetical protein